MVAVKSHHLRVGLHTLDLINKALHIFFFFFEIAAEIINSSVESL
jgi:hypothetical protein